MHAAVGIGDGVRRPAAHRAATLQMSGGHGHLPRPNSAAAAISSSRAASPASIVVSRATGMWTRTAPAAKKIFAEVIAPLHQSTNGFGLEAIVDHRPAVAVDGHAIVRHPPRRTPAPGSSAAAGKPA